MRLPRLLILGFLLTLPAGLAAAEEKNLVMEGTVASGQGSGLSAIINGQIVPAGGNVDGYQVLEVDAGGARMRNLATGEEKSLQAGGIVPEKFTPGPKPEKEDGLDGFLKKNFPALAGYKEKFQYAGILRDLRKVHFAAMQAAMDTGKPVTFDQLVEMGKLPPTFRAGVTEGYRLNIENTNHGARVSADPADRKSGKRHFLIDEHSYIYSEKERPATQFSPRYDSGYTLEVKPQ